MATTASMDVWSTRQPCPAPFTHTPSIHKQAIAHPNASSSIIQSPLRFPSPPSSLNNVRNDVIIHTSATRSLVFSEFIRVCERSIGCGYPCQPSLTRAPSLLFLSTPPCVRVMMNVCDSLVLLGGQNSSCLFAWNYFHLLSLLRFFFFASSFRRSWGVILLAGLLIRRRT